LTEQARFRSELENLSPTLLLHFAEGLAEETAHHLLTHFQDYVNGDNTLKDHSFLIRGARMSVQRDAFFVVLSGMLKWKDGSLDVQHNGDKNVAE